MSSSYFRRRFFSFRQIVQKLCKHSLLTGYNIFPQTKVFYDKQQNLRLKKLENANLSTFAKLCTPKIWQINLRLCKHSLLTGYNIFLQTKLFYDKLQNLRLK